MTSNPYRIPGEVYREDEKPKAKITSYKLPLSLRLKLWIFQIWFLLSLRRQGKQFAVKMILSHIPREAFVYDCCGLQDCECQDLTPYN